MENTQAPSSDRLSNLPHELVVSILTYLPIQDAARTSVLSSSWRDRWHNVPRLIFDNRFKDSVGPPTERVIETVNQIVYSHRRPILEFSLSLGGLLSSPEVNPVVNRVLERGHVRRLNISPPGHERQILPSELYLYPLLTHLNLRHCIFEPPPGFNGFHRLTYLVLTDVQITSYVLDHLISNCSQLERLIFQGVDLLGSFQIVAPKLKFLWLRAPLTRVTLVNAPLLETVILDRGLPVNTRIFLPRPDLIGFHSGLHAVEGLRLDYHSVQGLTADDLETPFVRLEILELFGISFGALDVISILRVIHNSPNLKKVSIEAFYIADSTRVRVQRFFEDIVRGSNFYFETMTQIEIANLAGFVVEEEFIKFVLTRSPVLEYMDLVLDSRPDANRSWNTLTEFFQIPSLSPTVHITLSGPMGE